MGEFHVYIYLDPRKPGIYNYGKIKLKFEPFYIGKGKDDRYKEHFDKSKNNRGKTQKFNKIKKLIKEGYQLDDMCVVLLDNINEDIAIKKEIELISLIGRKDIGLGPLLNLTNGGDGHSGHICSDDQKERIRLKVKESEYHKNGSISQLDNFDDIKHKISNKLIGNKNALGNIHSDITKKQIASKITEIQTGNYKIKYEFYNNGIFKFDAISQKEAVNKCKELKLFWRKLLSNEYKWKEWTCKKLKI